MSSNHLRYVIANANPNPNDEAGKREIDLGNGSDVVYVPRFLPPDRSWEWFHYLDKEIPWTRPTIHVFGRSCVQVFQCEILSVIAKGVNYPKLKKEGPTLSMQTCYRICTKVASVYAAIKELPRDMCYVASEGLSDLQYSGYQPHAYSWDEYPVLKDILLVVHEALPGSKFNSLLLNRYKTGSDYVSWHSDDEKLYGPTPEIASVSFGCEREFMLKRKPTKKPDQMQGLNAEKTASKRLKRSHEDQHSFVLKHGSLLVMRGYTQRDWVHSVPKRAKADAVRINLTFRRVIVGSMQL